MVLTSASKPLTWCGVPPNTEDRPVASDVSGRMLAAHALWRHP